MEFRSFQDVVGVKDGLGHYYGFHTKSLEVAEIDETAWKVFGGQDHAISIDEKEAFLELEQWAGQDTLADLIVYPQWVEKISININQICNLRCTYCAADGDGSYGSSKRRIDLDIVYQQVRFFLNQVPEGEIFEIHFFGGEPLLFPEAIQSIVAYAKLLVAGRKLELRFSITTNGTLVTPDIAHLLADIHCSVTISLDGPPHINDLSRRTVFGEGSSEMVAIGLEELARIRDQLRAVQFNCVVGAHNMNLIESYQYLKKWEPDFINFTFDTSCQDKRISAAYVLEIEKLAQFVENHYGASELFHIAPLTYFLSLIQNQTRVENHCSVGKSLIQVDTNNDLYPCSWFVNAPEEKVGTHISLDQEKLSVFADSQVEQNQCGSCWARYLCGGGCSYLNWEINGDKSKKDRYFCERTRAVAALAISYFVKINRVL